MAELLLQIALMFRLSDELHLAVLVLPPIVFWLAVTETFGEPGAKVVPEHVVLTRVCCILEGLVEVDFIDLIHS